MNYFKKRVSFGDILFQREYDVEGGNLTANDEDDEEEENHEDGFHDERSNNDSFEKHCRALTPIQCSPISSPLSTGIVLVS